MTYIIVIVTIWLLVLTLWVVNRIHFIYDQISNQYALSMKSMLLVREIIREFKRSFPDFDPETPVNKKLKKDFPDIDIV